MPKNEELIAAFTREEYVFQDDDPNARTIIARLDNGQTIKGKAPAGHLEPGLTYRFLGRWTTHPKHGRQFLFNSFTLSLPHGEQAVIKYLARLGTGYGIGKARARALWDAYQEQACEVIRTDPARVAADIPGIKLADAEALQEQFTRHAALESVTIEINNLLSNRGFGQRLVSLAIKEWGERAGEVITANPYVLMRFGGAGFMRCDALYLELGLDPAALHRQGYCLAHAMQSDSEGHTWYPVEFCAAYLRRSVAGAKLLLDEAIAWAIEQDLIAERTFNGKRFLAPLSAAVAERRVAEYVHRAQVEGECTSLRWPDLTGCVAGFDGREEIPGLSIHQANEAFKATSGILGILAGSPGTGKTFALAQIVKTIQATEGAARIAIAAPTGKAAVRATENLQNQGLTLAATTIHRLLKVVQQDSGEGWAFEHNEHNPLELDFLFIDEVSMCDTQLLASLLAARPAGCHVLLIGDPDQLAPVGRGAPLRDLIAAGIPTGHLKEIRRNAGRIVQECARIRDDGKIKFAARADVSAGENLVLVPRDSAEKQAGELEDILKQFLNKGGIKAAAWDCQVLVPLNEKSELSRKLLNKRLQKLLNPHGETTGNCPFRTGDKIVCLQNGRLPLVAGDANGSGKASEAYVANGEIGEVIEVNTGYLVVQLTLPDRLVRVPRDKQSENENGEQSAGCNFDLAYALSVHKCIHPETLLETAEGILPISEVIQNGDATIATPTGAKGFTKAFTYDEADTLQITTAHGYGITVTPNHRCEVFDAKEGHVLVEARHLQPGDWVRVKRGAVFEQRTPVVLPRLSRAKRSDCYCTVPNMMNAEFAEFLGLMVADGTVFPRGFRLMKRHKDVVERFRYLCVTLFGVSPIPARLGDTTGWTIHASRLARWLLNLGGLSPHTKRVPDCILRSSLSIQASFLKGLFEDGTVNLNGRNGTTKVDHIEWSTRYVELADVVRYLLLLQGVATTTATRGQQTMLYIYSNDIRTFRDKIGFVANAKNERLHLPLSNSTRYIIPCTKQEAKAIPITSETRYLRQNAIFRCTVSSDSAGKLAEIGVEWAKERLGWHYTQIKTIEPTRSKSMCIEVPEADNRFLQAGFPFGNSQGSEWPIVIVMLDAHGGARWLCDKHWLYTAISRAKKLCLCIGEQAVAAGMVRKSNMWLRKTFLREDIEGLRLDVMEREWEEVLA